MSKNKTRHDQVYDIKDARLATVNPDGSIGATVALPPVNLFAVPDEGQSTPLLHYFNVNDGDPLRLRFTRTEWQFTDLDIEPLLNSLFTEPVDMTRIFRLNNDGQVETLCRLKMPPKAAPILPRWWGKSRGLYLMWSVAHYQEIPARWYFVNILDQAVWKWALLNQMQLEDAVRELNCLWRAGRL